MAREPLCATFTAVTTAADWVTCAFHAEVTLWSPPNVHRNCQLVIAGPRLVTLTWAVNPPVHWFRV